MLRFNKGFMKENNTKIVTEYTNLNDSEKIKNIRLRMQGKVNLEEKDTNIDNNNVLKENTDIYKDRISALKNIKKD